MKNRKYLIFFLVLLITLFISINNVRADDIGSSTGGTESSEPTKCGGYNCYSLGTGGMRVALVGDDGKKIEGTYVIDYWYADPNASKDSTKAFLRASGNDNINVISGSNLKRDVFSQSNSSDNKAPVFNNIENKKIVERTNNRYNSKNIKNKFITALGKNILDNMTNKFDNGKYVGSDEHLNTRTAGATYTIVDRIYKNAQGKYGPKNVKYLDAILKDIDPKNERKNYSKAYYLQVEPVTQWANYGGFGNYGYKDYAFYGTPTEFAYLISSNKVSLQGNYTLNSFQNHDYKGPFNIGNATRYYIYARFGVYAQENFHPSYWESVTKKEAEGFEKDLDNLVGGPNDCYHLPSCGGYRNFDNMIKNMKSNKTYGVTFIKVSEGSCTNIALNYLKNSKSPSLYNLKKELSNKKIPESSYSWFDSFVGTDKLMTLADLKEYLESKAKTNENDCPAPNCSYFMTKYTAKETTISNNSKESYYIEIINALINASEKNSSSLSLNFSNNGEIKKLLNNIYKNFKSKTNDQFVGAGDARINTTVANFIFKNEFSKAYCGTVRCTDIEKKFKKNLFEKSHLGNGKTYYEWMGIMFPKLSLLQIENPDEETKAFLQDPNTDLCQKIPECETEVVDASCKNDNNKFTFEDSKKDVNGTTMTRDEFARLTLASNNNSCINSGIAYNNIGGKSVMPVYNTSNGERCWESVTFDLPGSVGESNPVEAGTVFRWGKNNSETSFGSMQIHRYCTISPVKSGAISKKIVINNKWAKIGQDVNPDIELFYKEALPKNGSKNYSAIILNNKRMNVVDKELSTYVYYRSSSTSSNLRLLQQKQGYDSITYTSSNALNLINNGGVVEYTANYNIEYDNNLKWYSDRSDNYKKKTEDDVKKSGEVDDKYLLLGYGLPTSFITPPIPEKTDFYYGYSTSNTDSKGYMYVTIKNIGTKRGTKYHFDPFISSSSKYVNDDDTSKNGELVYSCGFKIANQLYCNECDTITNEVPKGIDVVFRTVELVTDAKDLNKAFPGRSGKGTRLRGENWNLSSDGSEEATILTNDVYSYNPQYIIKLDSGRIQQIRKDNKEDKKNKKDPYTSLADYEFKKLSSTYGVINSDTVLKYAGKGGVRPYCNAGDKYACHKYEMIKYLSEKLKNNEGKYENWDYTYAASPYLSKLAKKGWIESRSECINTETDTKMLDTYERARARVYTLGC